jgi:hypothetical protein
MGKANSDLYKFAYLGHWEKVANSFSHYGWNYTPLVLTMVAYWAAEEKQWKILSYILNKYPNVNKLFIRYAQTEKTYVGLIESVKKMVDQAIDEDNMNLVDWLASWLDGELSISETNKIRRLMRYRSLEL